MIRHDLTEFNRLFVNPRSKPSIVESDELPVAGPILAQHSKPYFDDFLQRARHNQTWLDVQAYLPIPRLPNHHLPPKPPVAISRDINPHAKPFIPSRPLVHVAPQITIPPGRTPHPPWFSAFWAGTRVCEPGEQAKHACSLIDHRRWTMESIVELAQHFFWKGGEGMSEEVVAVAPFAKVVYTRFRDVLGEWYAQSFLWHLRETMLAAFDACWLSGRTYDQRSVASVSSALSLCVFIGGLLNQNLLTPKTVYECIDSLIGSLHSTEDIHAVHLLLLHANKKLWRKHADEISGLVTSLRQRTKVLRMQEAECWVEEIAEMVGKWKMEMYAQILGCMPPLP